MGRISLYPTIRIKDAKNVMIPITVESGFTSYSSAYYNEQNGAINLNLYIQGPFTANTTFATLGVQLPRELTTYVTFRTKTEETSIVTLGISTSGEMKISSDSAAAIIASVSLLI